MMENAVQTLFYFIFALPLELLSLVSSHLIVCYVTCAKASCSHSDFGF